MTDGDLGRIFFVIYFILFVLTFVWKKYLTGSINIQHKRHFFPFRTVHKYCMYESLCATIAIQIIGHDFTHFRNE